MAKEQPVTPAQADEIAELKQQIAQMQALMQAQLAGGGMGVEAVRVLAERSAPRENPSYTLRSVFNPEGVDKPDLRRPTFFIGMRMREDELTPAEVELFNAFDTDRILPGKPYGPWEARIRRNGTQEELHVTVPSGSADARMDLPSLSAILAELLTGNVQRSQGEITADLLAKVQELERKLAAVA